MKNTLTRICIGILIAMTVLVVVGIILSALDSEDAAGAVAGGATALGAAGWVLAMRNLNRAEKGDFSSEGKNSIYWDKLFTIPVSDEPDSPGTARPQDSEWL